jgi:hypothetical protein
VRIAGFEFKKSAGRVKSNSMATTKDATVQGKVVRKPPRFKRRLEESDIVGPRGVPKILKDLSDVKFSKDNKVHYSLNNRYACVSVYSLSTFNYYVVIQTQLEQYSFCHITILRTNFQ